MWPAALALALVHDGREDAAGEVLDGLAPRLPVEGVHWLGFVGVAVAVEAASSIGHRRVLAAACPVLDRRSDDHVVLGSGAMDYGPVDRYRALALAGLGHHDEARRLMERVASDRRSGRVWQRRAVSWLDAAS